MSLCDVVEKTNLILYFVYFFLLCFSLSWYDKHDNCKDIPDGYSSIDHILVTKGLHGQVKSVRFYHGYEEGCGVLNSDHYPLIIDFYV